MSPDLVWSYAPVTVMSVFFGISVVSFKDLCRDEICAKFAQFLFGSLTISLTVLTYFNVFGNPEFQSQWVMIVLTDMLWFFALQSLWKTLKQYKLIVLIFETIKLVDNRLDSLGHTVEHWRIRKYTIISVAANVISGVVLCKFLTVGKLGDSLFLSYAIHSQFVHLICMLCAMITNFCVSILTLCQRLQVLGKCINDLNFIPRMNLKTNSVLGVLPAVEFTVPQFSDEENQKQELLAIKTICRELFEVLHFIADYYSTSVACFTVDLVFRFVGFSYGFKITKYEIKLTGVVCWLVICSVYTFLSLLSCTLLETEVN